MTFKNIFISILHSFNIDILYTFLEKIKVYYTPFNISNAEYIIKKNIKTINNITIYGIKRN
jgi:hypothetical protein